MQTLDYREQIYQQTKLSVDNHENCCIVNAYGSVKTSIMIRLIQDNHDKNIILVTKQKNAKDYYRSFKELKEIPIVTYNKMHNDFKNNNTDLYESADLIFLDEAHYIGTEKWGNSFKNIIKKNNPIIVGLTETPQRFEDIGTDNTIVDDLF